MYWRYSAVLTLWTVPITLQVKKDEKELTRGFGAGFKLDVEELLQTGETGVI